MIREELLKEARPILFNTEMVQTILEDRKMVTRRVMKPQPIFENGFWEIGGAAWSEGIKTFHPVYGHSLYNKMPYKPGDYLYVRETYGTYSKTYGTTPNLYYKADGDAPENIEWHPSIHMPKEAARIFLRVTDVRVERLQEITGRECVKEGIPESSLLKMGDDFTIGQFHDLWDSTIKPKDRDKYGWDANPYVWKIEFERVEVEK